MLEFAVPESGLCDPSGSKSQLIEDLFSAKSNFR
jgi:hypothetical protein